MENRNFRLDSEWNMIHYPYKPNGFGVLIIGDERHFVDNKNSFWTQNEGKRALLQDLKDAGYTIFYSNLYGLNWGSQKAVEQIISLCSYVHRKEILNERIHVLAEGMGALVALKLIQTNTRIRSIMLINPILSLKAHLEQEKENKFFYKKILNELSFSYQINPDEIHIFSNNIDDFPKLKGDIPVNIIHVLSGNRAYGQSKLLKKYSSKWEQEKMPVSVSYLVPEKKLYIGSQCVRFFNKHEGVL